MKDKIYIKRAIVLLAIVVLFIVPLVDATSFLREPRKNTVGPVKSSLIYSEPGTLSRTYSTPLRQGSSATRILGDYGIDEDEKQGKYYNRPKTMIYRRDAPAEYIGDRYDGRSAISTTGLTVNFENRILQDDVKLAPFRKSRLYADMSGEYEENKDFGNFELKSSRWLAGDYSIKERRGRYYYSGSTVMDNKNRKLY